MKAFVVGTAGHVDHGKTALVRELTGVETDRWEEEKERGLTIDLGFARLDVGGEAEVGVVDVPGHEDFVSNMLAGATGLDLLLLVVAADEGPMPQTREHLTIARLLGVREGVVALTKMDRVEAEWADLAEEAVREELLTVLGHDEWPVVRTSAVDGTGLEALRAEIGRRAEALQERPASDLFRLPVDRSFSVRGAGTVVTGTSWSGTARLDDRFRVLPGDRDVRVRSLEVHGERREAVGPGRRCALALVGVDAGDVPRGATVVEGQAWRPVERLGVRIRRPAHTERGLEDGQRVRVYLGTREVMARAELTVPAVEPGRTVHARLSLEEPLVARVRDRFVVRFYSPVITIGGGQVAELSPGPDWTGRQEAWDRLLDGEPATALRTAVELAGGRGLPSGEAPLATGLPREPLRAMATSPPDGLLRLDDLWFRKATAEALEERLRKELARIHRDHRRQRGASLEALRRAAGEGYADALVERTLSRLEASGEVVVEGPRVRLPGHTPTLTDEERELKERLVDAVAAGGLEPPTVSELGDRLEVSDRLLHQLLELLEADGRLVAVGPEIYLPDERARELRRLGGEVAREHGPAGVPHFKDVFGVSRKYLIPFLEYLDAEGVTRRTGEGRVPAGEKATR